MGSTENPHPQRPTRGNKLVDPSRRARSDRDEANAAKSRCGADHTYEAKFDECGEQTQGVMSV